MAVAVLNPQDCLNLPNPSKHPRNLRRTPNPNPNRTQSNRRKRSPNPSPPRPKAPAKNLVMGQVKILKRGEVLKESKPVKPTKLERGNENADADLGSTDCLGPDPVSVPAQIQTDESKNGKDKALPVTFYAGSAFITSPPPSSVPLPAFFSKKIVTSLEDDVATSALRRMLRLEL